MTYVASAAAVVAFAPNILDDAAYTEIRKEFHKTALKEKVFTAAFPYLDWGQMCAQFQAHKPLIKPLSDRVSTWQPDHEDAQKVKKLFIDLFALLEHSNEDHREAAIVKTKELMKLINHHEREQEVRDKRIQQEQRKKALAFEMDFKSPDLLPAGQLVAVAIDAASHAAALALFKEIEAFAEIRTLIPQDWLKDGANFSELSKRTYNELTVALIRHRPTHPVLVNIHAICFHLVGCCVLAKKRREDVPQLCLEFQRQLGKLKTALSKYEEINLRKQGWLETMQTQQTQRAQERQKEKMDNEALFSTPLPQGEMAPLGQLRELTLCIWPPKTTTYETALNALSHPRFPDLQQALEIQYTHPVPREIQRACKETIELLSAGARIPTAEPLITFTRNMQRAWKLVSEETFAKLCIPK